MKISIKKPKIKIGNPAKLVTNAVKGVTNLQTDIIKSQIDGISSVSGSALGAVGGVLSNPAAAPLIGAAGAAFGVPEAGLLAGSLLGGASKKGMNPSPAPVVDSYIPTDSSQPGGISKTMMIAGAGAIVLILAVVLFLRKKGKR